MFSSPLFYLPRLTPELNRIALLRINKVPSNEVPSTDEFFWSMVTLFTLENITSGIYNKVIIICNLEYLTASVMPLMMSVFHDFFLLITVSLLIFQDYHNIADMHVVMYCTAVLYIIVLYHKLHSVSYTHLTLPTIYSV